MQTKITLHILHNYNNNNNNNNNVFADIHILITLIVTRFTGYSRYVVCSISYKTHHIAAKNGWDNSVVVAEVVLLRCMLAQITMLRYRYIHTHRTHVFNSRSIIYDVTLFCSWLGFVFTCYPIKMLSNC